MNEDYVVQAYVAWNFAEASEELARLVSEMEQGKDIDEVEFQVAMAHIYG